MSHTHLPANYALAFRFGIGINLVYVVIEAAIGFAVDSMALVSDAGHNLSDVLALLLAWGAFWLSGTRPTERRTYGLKRATIFASGISAVLLFVALGAVSWEAISRLADPARTSGLTIVVVAGIGVVINGATAAMFMAGRHSDLNIKGAFLHMAADAVVSLGVVVAGVVIYLTDWQWVDPVIALVVAVAILASGVGFLRDSLELAMDAVPGHIDPGEVRRYLGSRPGVSDVHHLHIWAMSTTETALTVHLVLEDRADGDTLLRTVCAELGRRFAIQHPTIQLETSDAAAGCASGRAPSA